MTKSPVIRIIACELIISGIISAVITATHHYELLLTISLLYILIGRVCLWAADKPVFTNKFNLFVSSQFGRIASFTPIILISLFLLFFNPGKTVVLSISFLLLSDWLIGIQLIWLSDHNRLNELSDESSRRGNALSFLSLLFTYGFLLIPSRIPSLLSGAPIDQPVEFIIAVIVIPTVWIINRQFFFSKILLTILLALLIIKAMVCVLLPQGGLGIQVFTSPQAISNGQWQPTYDTWLNTSYSTIMQGPYKSMREFPVEWVNNRHGFDFDQFWMALEVTGTIQLYDEGKLVFVVRGAKQIELAVTDTNTGQSISAVFVNDFEKLNSDFYRQLPTSDTFDIHGTVLFTKFGEARFEPVLIYPDGSTNSVFKNAGVWLSQDDMLPQNQMSFFENLLNLLSVIFIALITYGIIEGVTSLYLKLHLSTIDIYLVFSILAVYHLSTLIEKPKMPFFTISILIILTTIKVFDFKFSPSYPNFKSYVIFTGLIFLLGYLSLDINNLKSIVTLPPAQDGLEYQTFGRNIFVHKDVLLEQTPPRAYKVLFPYIVGVLHTLFGQSTAAQFILSAWCAVLSAALTFDLAKKFQLSQKNAFLASNLFLIILCTPSSYIYYFRFGLIEPIAILCLLTVLFFALERKTANMRLAAILTVLFRWDYLGIVLAALILTHSPISGRMKTAWKQLFEWANQNIKAIIFHILLVILFPILIIAGYFFFTPNYMLNASDVEQSSLSSMLEGFMRVMIGGSFRDLREIFIQGSFSFLAIVLPLFAGLIISFLAIFYRQGIFSKIDLRLALLVPSILPAYIAVRPAAYFPRFSFPILALDILLIGMFLHQLKNKLDATSNWKIE